MTQKRTEKIKIWGIVQGVGFRPFVAKLADRLGMKGEVLNIGGLVDVVVTDTPQRIDGFVEALQRDKPEPAEIVHIRRQALPVRQFDSFTILGSDDGGDEAAMLPADLSICKDCMVELAAPDNPRYGHPFISCMACGPRYTIIDKIPYDRENTSMIDFPMCDFCRSEYTDRADRRYHAQTISCHHCGPMLEYVLREKVVENQSQAGGRGIEESEPAGEWDFRAFKTKPLLLAVKLLRRGQVIGFKGVGGYNLICDPFNQKAVAALRRIKAREQKPFAVMFQDMEQIRAFCYVDDTEERLLSSSAKPILLLERKAMDWEEFKQSRFIGAFLPSMGAQQLLLWQYGRPLIVTSANLSDYPMIKDDEQMLELMEKQPLIAAVFYNQRQIRVRMDDSVARAIDGQPQMIRRSKGYAPVPLYINGGRGTVLATGGQLKNSFCLTKGPFAYVSQYFGDLDSVENQQIYEENVERMKALFRIEPQTVVCDLHPNYVTTAFAENYALTRGLPLIRVQHHHAHVASVMAEHDLEGPVIGVSFDGTGYGTDGAVWGGEFLLCQEAGFERLAHLKYVKMLGGDGSMKEGWKSALCYEYAWENGYGKEMDEDEAMVDLGEIMKFSKLENPAGTVVKAALDHNVNVIKSSSMGRLFDAVAALLGIKEENDFEGQCAILLEDAAARAEKAPGVSTADDLALKFHKDVSKMILDRCLFIRNRRAVSKVALTGGVFQNKILMEETLRLLRGADFEVYYNVSVSPNDGGIALGQAFIAMRGNKRHGN